jgi:hypothetical protein
MQTDRNIMQGMLSSIDPKVSDDETVRLDSPESLEKSRKDLRFPHLTNKWTRPENEIHQINRFRDVALFAHKMRKMYSGYPQRVPVRETLRDEKDLVQELANARSNAAISQKAFKDYYGIDLDKDNISQSGAVFSPEVGQSFEPTGYAMNEHFGNEMPSVTKHEGIHWLIGKIARDIPKPKGHEHIHEHEIANKIYDKLNDVIEPTTLQYLQEWHEKTRNTGDQYLHRERVTDLHTLLHSYSHRVSAKTLLQIPDEGYREIDNSMKRSWDNVTKRASEMTVDDIFDLTKKQK